jgi:hypothetical protein
MHFNRKKGLLNEPIPPDFHRFRHRQESFANPKGQKGEGWLSPLWVVGVSPFDAATTSSDGYIAHIGEPRFTARWKMLDESLPVDVVNQIHHLDEDLNILVYEVSFDPLKEAELSYWLFEAACAVAYSRGLMCDMEPPENN